MIWAAPSKKRGEKKGGIYCRKSNTLAFETKRKERELSLSTAYIYTYTKKEKLERVKRRVNEEMIALRSVANFEAGFCNRFGAGARQTIPDCTCKENIMKQATPSSFGDKTTAARSGNKEKWKKAI
jgi:hypothetical protein